MQKKSKAGLGRWLPIMAACIIVDVGQWICDAFVVGAVISEGADAVMTAVCFTVIPFVMRIPIYTRTNRLAALVGGDLADVLTAGIMPGWTGAIFYIWKDVKKEEAEEAAAAAAAPTGANQPLNAGGVRAPSNQNKPAVSDGRREPKPEQPKAPATQAPGPDGGQLPNSTDSSQEAGKQPIQTNPSKPEMTPEEKHYWDIKNDYEHRRNLVMKNDPKAAAARLVESDRSYRDIIERAASIGAIKQDKISEYLSILTPPKSAGTEENPLAA